MINLGKFFLKNGTFLILTAIVFSFGGIYSFIHLNRNEDPGFKIRTASILTTDEGQSAENIDLKITRPIERELLSMEEAEYIEGKSYPNKSVIYVTLYESFKNIQPIWDRLRRKMELVKPDIPNGLVHVINDEYGDVFGGLIGISGENLSYEELYDITKKIKDEFLELKSRGKVEIFGKKDEVVYIYFKNPNLSSLQLSPNDLIKQIENSNTINNSSIIETKENLIEINPKNEFKKIDDIKNTTINLNNKPILIEDFFNVEKTTKTPNTHEVRSFGKKGLVIGISLKNRGNILVWGNEIKNKVKELKEKYKNVEIEILALQSEYVKKLTDKFTSSLIESILGVIFVVSIILGIKSGIITGAIIFITILSTFCIMKSLNIGLDKVSLSALIISLGILVDNSIVILQESIKSEFKEIQKSVIFACEKFQTPLLIVTLTTALSFLPVYIANSTVGEYTSNLFRVVFITLFFSWFYSVSLLPYLIYKFVKKETLSKKEFFLIPYLKNKSANALNKPKQAVFIGICLFLFSCLLFNFIPKIFFPSSDRNMFEIKLTLKNGVNFDKTKNATVQIENFLKQNEDIKNFSSYIGTSAPRYVLSASPEADNTNTSTILVNTKNYKTIEKNISQTKNFINRNLAETEAVVRTIPTGPPWDAPIEIRILNKEPNALFKYANIVSNELSKEKGVYLVKNNWGDLTFEYKIKVNKNAAQNAGLDPVEIFDFLNTYYRGKTITNYYRGDIKIPVILKGESPQILDINSISIYSKAKNRIIPIKQVADVKVDLGYSKIFRRNNFYALSVQGWTDENASANDIAKKFKKKLDKIEGLNYEFGGILEKSNKGTASINEKIPIAFFIIFFILSAYFNDIKKSIIVVLCGFMAISGAVFGLFITKSDFGFITFLGLICLVGICINNGVILVSEIKSQTKEEILNAANLRTEPILLTALTTIMGMLPLWLKKDPMFSTLGIAIIFGLISSIMITLFFLPSVIYLLRKK